VFRFGATTLGLDARRAGLVQRERTNWLLMARGTSVPRIGHDAREETLQREGMDAFANDEHGIVMTRE
jgi:hypothetical protein